MSIATVYPATSEIIKTFEPYDDAEVERRLALAHSAYTSYRRTSFAERAEVVQSPGRHTRVRTGRNRQLLTLEMGKPVVQARSEVAKCFGVLRYSRARRGAAPPTSLSPAPPPRSAPISSTSRSARCWR